MELCPKGFSCPVKDTCSRFHPNRLCIYGNGCYYRKQGRCVYKHNIDIVCHFSENCRNHKNGSCDFFHPKKIVMTNKTETQISTPNRFAILEEPQIVEEVVEQVLEPDEKVSKTYTEVSEPEFTIVSKKSKEQKMKQEPKTTTSVKPYKLCKFKHMCPYKENGKCNFLHSEDIFPFKTFTEFQSCLIGYLERLSREYTIELEEKLVRINEKRNENYQKPYSFDEFKGHSKYIVTDINIDFSLLSGEERETIEELFPLILNKTLHDYNSTSDFTFTDTSNPKKGKKLIISIEK